MKLRFINLTILLILLSFVSVSAKDSAAADDEWISVRSKNFYLIGNAKDKDIRKVATKLEQFRETFRLLFPKVKFDQSIATNVVVFKNEKSYKPFLPKRENGKADTGIAGYFQPGEDVNYITLSTGGDINETYGTIFHEYVHFLLNANFGRSVIPPWFNEGLAEYYQTFTIEDDQKVFLGNLQENHLYFLNKSELIPLNTFFSIDNYSLHRNGDHSRSIFYAQAWALMHYLIQSKQGDNMNKFLNFVMNDVEPEKAFKQAFGSDYSTMENALKKYVKQRTYQISVATLQNKLLFDTEMTTTPLTEADANAYLGDLLYHMHEYDDAEIYLQKSLAADAENSLANTAFGLVRMRQKKFDEAKKYLQKAIAANRQNHFAHYNYAYVLSRESLDESGRVTGYPAETAEIMRKSLLEAIRLNPDFAESYQLFAFINLINNEKLDESVNVLQKALVIHPGNTEYSLLLAQIYLRQEKFDEAEKLAAKISRTAVEENERSQAQSVLNGAKMMRENQANIAQIKSGGGQRIGFYEDENVRKKSSLTANEIGKIKLNNQIINLNRQIFPPLEDEKIVVGNTQRIECINGGIKYTVKTADGILLLRSKDFQSLQLLSLSPESETVLVGCDAQMQAFKTVYTYKIATDAKMKTVGNIVRMAFVPDAFQLKSAAELADSQEIMIIDDAELQNLQTQSLKNSLRKPAADEKRSFGIAKAIECFKNDTIFRVEIGGKELKLKTNSPEKLDIRMFTPDMVGTQFGCGVKIPPVDVVITYRPIDSGKYQGEIIALEFVPNKFDL